MPAPNPFLSEPAPAAAELVPVERTAAGHPICGADTGGRTRDSTCHRTAGQGTDHYGYGSCSRHGGNSPSGKKSAANKELTNYVSAAMGAPVETDPGEALMWCIAATAGHVKYLAEKVGAFEISDTHTHIQYDHLGRPTGLETPDIGYLSINQEAWYKLYLIERQRLFDHSAMAVRVGLESRQLDIMTRIGDKLAELIDAMISSLNLTPEQHELASAKIPVILRQFGDGLR